MKINVIGRVLKESELALLCEELGSELAGCVGRGWDSIDLDVCFRLLKNEGKRIFLKSKTKSLNDYESFIAENYGKIAKIVRQVFDRLLGPNFD